MSDGDALLAAIRAHPDEDTPRLAYADWLEETGSPARARFIRQQVERVDQGGTWWNMAGSKRKPTKFVELLNVLPWAEPRIVAPEPPRAVHLGYVQPSTSCAAVLWRRGFIEAVMCTPGNLVVYAGVLSAHPLREIRLVDRLTIVHLQNLLPGTATDTKDWYSPRHRDLCQDVLPLAKLPQFPGLIHCVYDPFKPSSSYSPFYLVGKRPTE